MNWLCMYPKQAIRLRLREVWVVLTVAMSAISENEA